MTIFIAIIIHIHFRVNGKDSRDGMCFTGYASFPLDNQIGYDEHNNENEQAR